MRFTSILTVIGILGITLIPATAKAEVHNELPLSSKYDFRNDPFLVDWTFLESVKKEEVSEELSKEDKILLRWKEKQALLWDTLEVGKKFTINASAYTAAADECGKSDGITASGLRVTEKRTLACPRELPFGTKIKIEGMGEYRCEDRGGAIKGNKIDIYMETKKEAFAFGRQHLEAEIVN
ncbi:MAG: hypothetical protein E6P95_03925 [Candidatus Moraniibacteriota bacterium]|nr:MAG: hypothetical protein E6P95_03925 [Candidatus Moranbacteria bacterium]